MLITLVLLTTFSRVLMTSPPTPSPTLRPSSPSTVKYPNFKYLLSNKNSNTFPSNISLGELMIEACSLEAESAFEQRKASPGVIACCQALTLVDCMFQQCRSLFDDDHQNDSSSVDHHDDQHHHHHHNPIAECSQLRLAALKVSMNALCEMVNVRNLSLTVCSTLPLTANLGLVAALMIAAFLLITIFCGLYMWTQNKLIRRKQSGEPRATSAAPTATGATLRPPDKRKSVADKMKRNSSSSTYSSFLGKRKSRTKTKKMMVKSGKGQKSFLKRNRQSENQKLIVKSSNSSVKKMKKQ